MKLKHKNHIIELFDDVKQLPILRFQAFQKYQLLAADVGSTIEDYDKNTQVVYEFLSKDLKEDALQALDNRRQTFFNCIEQNTPLYNSLSSLVKSIDGVEFTQDEDVINRLNDIGFSFEQAVEVQSEVKKKFKINWKRIFQNILVRE